jgi:hypothetical protein
MTQLDDNTHRKEEHFGDNTKSQALIITGIYFFVIIFVWGYAHSLGNKLGIGIENEKLNSLGDLLSGIFAPVAFIWLVAAVNIQSKELSAQRVELALTRSEMEQSRAVMQKQADAADQQTKLAIASTQANYQLALFDKRIEVYKQLEAIVFELNSVGTINQSLQVKIRNTTEAAKFVFDNDVSIWIRDLSEKTFTVMRNDIKINSINTRNNQTINLDKLEKLQAENSELLNLIYEQFSFENIDKYINPYLRIPATITI